MSIKRIGTTTRWSDTVIHQNTLYVVEVANTMDADVRVQSEEVLANLLATLQKNGSDRTHLLQCTIYLDDIREIDVFNSVWDAWVPAGTAPVRACVQARLAKPGYLVEIQAVAALKD